MRTRRVGQTSNRQRNKASRERKNYTTCVRCGSTEDLTWDHVIPKYWLKIHGLSPGFAGMLNLQRLCYDCNQGKSDLRAIDYRGDAGLHKSLQSSVNRAGAHIIIHFESE